MKRVKIVELYMYTFAYALCKEYDNKSFERKFGSDGTNSLSHPQCDVCLKITYTYVIY